MRRVACHLFTAAAAFSLLLCVLVGGMWVYGELSMLRVSYNHASQTDDWRMLHLLANSYRGTLHFTLSHRRFTPAYFRAVGADGMHDGRFRTGYPPGLQWDVRRTSHPLHLPMSGWDAQYSVGRGWIGYRDDSWQLALPHWLPMALLAVLPALWVRRFVRARRVKREGLCAACGYDLRASPGRCPECGTVAPSAAAAKAAA